MQIEMGLEGSQRREYSLRMSPEDLDSLGLMRSRDWRGRLGIGEDVETGTKPGPDDRDPWRGGWACTQLSLH